ncbi:MAG: major capsid protein [Acinetobacter junii]
MQNNQLPVQEKRGVLTLRNVSTYGLGATVGGALALAPTVHAASSIDATGLTAEIDGSKATVIALFGAGLIILGIFAGWRYLKRGANSA